MLESARRAAADDLDVLTSLASSATLELRELRGGARLTADLDAAITAAGALADHLDDPERLTVVGEFAEVAIGLAIVHLDRRGAAPYGVVDVLYVEPPAREVGVAEAMMDIVVDWCRDAGCRGIDAWALPGSRPAKAFLEAHGFITRLLTMHRPLPPAGREEG
ncbi:MAG: GNAT family N-acetyltransferase [Acidimicrobiales bacterium]